MHGCRTLQRRNEIQIAFSSLLTAFDLTNLLVFCTHVACSRGPLSRQPQLWRRHPFKAFDGAL
jgi:hypothetical protein